METENLRGKLFEKVDNISRFRNVKSNLEFGDLNAVVSPKVTIVVPIYNRPAALEETLLSLINQDYAEAYEIVVVDNHVTDDGTPSPNFSVVRKVNNPKILYYRHEQNLGFEGNCNRGVELARAPYVTFCHDDDLLLPTALSRLMYLQKLVGEKCITSAYYTIDSEGKIRTQPWTIYGSKKYKTKDWFNYSLYEQMLASSGLHIGSLWNKRNFLEVGGYNPDYMPCQDYALHTIYTYYYGGVFNSVATCKYRVADNASLTLYTQFADAQRFIMSEIAKKIWWLPMWFKKLIISANYKEVALSSEITFGNGNLEDLPVPTKFEKYALWAANWIPRHRVIKYFDN